jgi:hypothetical protein
MHFHGKSPITSFLVIPADPGSGSGIGAGIQVLRALAECLDPGDPVPAKAGNRSDDFLRSHQLFDDVENCLNPRMPACHAICFAV